jgi:AraC family transcriptional regulator
MHSALMDNLLLGQSGIAGYPPGATFGPRLLYDFEFIWIIEGSAKVELDQHRFEAPAGAIWLGRPGMTQRFDWDTRTRTIHAFLHFSFDYSAPGWPPLNQWPVVRQIASEDILRPLFRYVIGLARGAPTTPPQLMESAVTLMLQSFLSGRTAVVTEPHEDFPPAIQKSLAAIRQALAKEPPAPLTLKHLARAAHVTPEHLCRLFRRHLSMGPLECVGLARLERASALLVRTNLPVRQIADATGFVSPYHFSNKFRKVYGYSPRDYRLSMQSGFFIPGNPVIQQLFVPTVKLP